MNDWGCMFIRPDGTDDSFGMHFRYYWRMRHESATARQFCRTLVAYERIRRERVMDAVWLNDDFRPEV